MPVQCCPRGCARPAPRRLWWSPMTKGCPPRLPRVAATPRVLPPEAAEARPVLSEGLRQAGAEAVVVVAYDKGLPAEAPAQAERLFRDSPIGWVTFTSPRIVRHFVDLFGEEWGRGCVLLACGRACSP